MSSRASRVLIASWLGVLQGAGFAVAAGKHARPAAPEPEPLEEMKSPDVAPLPEEFILEDPTKVIREPLPPAPEPEPELETAPEPESEQALIAPPAPPPPTRPATLFGGYVDFGFFIPSGNGAGWIQDTGPNRIFPVEGSQYNWVFLGDIMSPPVNSRGEPADLGDAPGVVRADGIDSNGKMGFILNEVNLNVNAALFPNVLGTASVNFTPRTGSNFSLGDSLDVDIAQFEWLLGASQRTSIFVGKFDSVIGIEYRERKASQKFGITPTLLARYTTGTPLGVKMRTKLGESEWFVLAAALTNGSSVIEPFHFYDEIDSNNGKTASGRASIRLPVPFELELGLSGMYGAQDRALDARGHIWFWGPDLLSQIGPVVLKGQLLYGGADGETDRVYADKNRPYGLDLKLGAYLEADVMLGRLVGVMARGEVRDARVWLGGPATLTGQIAERIYITQSWRATLGLRVVISDRMVAKAEYLWNGEYGLIPDIMNNVFTTSCVWLF